MKTLSFPDAMRNIVTAKDVLLRAKATLFMTTLTDDRVKIWAEKSSDFPNPSLISSVVRDVETSRNIFRVQSSAMKALPTVQQSPLPKTPPRDSHLSTSRGI